MSERGSCDSRPLKERVQVRVIISREHFVHFGCVHNRRQCFEHERRSKQQHRTAREPLL